MSKFKMFGVAAIVVALLAGTIGSVFAAVEFKKPEDAVKHRQASFTLMGKSLSTIGDMANGKTKFDQKEALEQAEVLRAVARGAFSGFAMGATVAGVSKALPEVWSEPGKFKKAGDEMNANVEALLAAAQGGSIDAVKAAAGKTGGSCKSCHDDFKAK